MVIMGIDPGYGTIGYGFVKYDQYKFTPIQYGAITTGPGMPMPLRLCDRHPGRAGARRHPAGIGAKRATARVVYAFPGQAVRGRLWQGRKKAGHGNDARDAGAFQGTAAGRRRRCAGAGNLPRARPSISDI